MCSSNNILIRFIRDRSSSKSDDTAKIERVGTSQYKLTYTYGEWKNKLPLQLMLTDRAVFRWMRNTINLLERDSAPFETVQLDFPFMPSVLIEIKDLGSAYHSILDAVEFHLDNWDYEVSDYNYDYDTNGYSYNPKEHSMSSVRPSGSTHHIFMDEDY